MYPLVKSKFPIPGSLIKIPTEEGIIYSVVTCKSVDFYNKIGEKTGLTVHGKRYTTLDLTKGGDTHPSIVLNFAENTLGIDVELLKSFSE